MLSTLVAVMLTASSPRLASPQWNLVNVDQSLGAFLADHLASGLRSNGLEVVTAQEIATLLGQERQLSLLGCSELAKNCLAELGSALGADATVVGSVAKLGSDTYQCNVKVLSTTDGRVLAEVTMREKGQEDLLDALTRAAATIAGKLRGGAAVTPEPPEVQTPVSRGSGPKVLVPLIAGGAVAIAGGVMVGVAGGTHGALKQQLDQGTVTDGAAFRSQASTGATLQTLGWVGVGVGAAAMLAGGALWFFGNDTPVQPNVSLSPQGGAIGVSGVW